jgi:hypothetical protein
MQKVNTLIYGNVRLHSATMFPVYLVVVFMLKIIFCLTMSCISFVHSMAYDVFLYMISFSRWLFNNAVSIEIYSVGWFCIIAYVSAEFLH